MDWIAGYAAVVGTAALGWEVWKATRPRRPEVNVDLKVAWSDGKAHRVCMLVVRNRGDHRIRVEKVAVRMHGKQVIEVLLTEGLVIDATIPGPVEPSDAGIVFFDPDDLREAGIDLRRPVDGYVQLSTQEGFYSSSVVLHT
jgi:hypothetical protein